MMRFGKYVQGIAMLVTGLLSGCIENDIPYPVIKGEIKEIETVGFVSSTINKETREVTVLVDDTTDLRNVSITKLLVSEGVTIAADSLACMDVAHFPVSGFASVDSLPTTANTRINLSKQANFILRTYQDYPWTITAKRNIQRSFKLKSATGEEVQVSTPLVDEQNKQVIIYVDKKADLSKLLVEEMRLGSSIAKTTPDPLGITDFRRPQAFKVSAFGEEEEWTVSVVHFNGSAITLSVWSKRAYLVGDAAPGAVVSIQYRREGGEEWDQVFDDEIEFADGRFTAVMRHLTPSTTYEYQYTIGTQKIDVRTFTTDPAPQLPNNGFENWHKYRDPDLKVEALGIYGENEEMFWDSGNWGSATLKVNITTNDDAGVHGGKYSAKLQSQFVGALGIGKFAAGNIFAGKYVGTDVMDGILDFGRPFTVRPTTLKGWFKYKPQKLDKYVSDELAGVADAQKGQNDKATIYIAVGDWDKPVRIQTKKADRKLFDKNDPHIIAFQEMEVSETVGNWTEFKLKLDYRSLTRKPKYILVVASASKYGDYFTGGDGSTLWVDDFELVYE